jgi:hypothetical protein
MRGEATWPAAPRRLLHGGPAPHGTHVIVVVALCSHPIRDGYKTPGAYVARRRDLLHERSRPGRTSPPQKTGGPIERIYKIVGLSLTNRCGGSWRCIMDARDGAGYVIGGRFWQWCEAASSATMIVFAHTRGLASALVCHKRDRGRPLALQTARRGEDTAQ